MQVLRIRRKTESKIELAQLLLSVHCLMAKIKINQTERTVLAYFMVYGIKKSTKDLILKSLILNSYNSLENTLSRLRKLGLVIRDVEGFTKVCPQLSSKKGWRIRLVSLSN
jgi:DNA-binding transcriptional ArsR family regulator